VSVYIVRAVVQLRDVLASSKELSNKLDEFEIRLERKLQTHDQAIVGIFKTIRELMSSPKAILSASPQISTGSDLLLDRVLQGRIGISEGRRKGKKICRSDCSKQLHSFTPE